MAKLFEFVGNHFLLVATFVGLLVAFVLNEMRRGGRTVSAQQLVDLVNREDAVIVDVRDRKEFDAGHIVDAINIPLASLESRVDELKPHADKPIVVTCRMGQHSGAAGTTLRKAGYENVMRLTGGMMEWRNASLPVVKG
jgi:rhodanese-related sulfurtransferase